jgi:hypothetical protein
MNTPTAEELLTIKARDGYPVLGEYDLTSGAAWLVARKLSANWDQALHEGSTLDECLSDVDVVIRLLKEWKAEVKKKWRN